MGATFQSNFAPFADEDAKKVFVSDMWGSGAVLSEAYLQYNAKNTMVKIGRQFISTPLIAGSGSRMIKQSFEGAVISNTDLPGTTLAAGYVDKWQSRTDGSGNVADFTDIGTNNDGAYMVLAINKSIPGLTVTGQWAQVTDLADILYAELAYAGKMSDFKYGLAAQYIATDYDAAASDDSSLYGLKASLGMGAFNMYVAYAEVDGDGTVSQNGGVGGADPIYTAQIIGSGEYSAGSKGYAIDANYEVVKGAKVGARYSDINLVTANKDYTLLDLYANYAFDGSLKGFAVELQYEDKSGDSGVLDGNELRFRANYKF